MAINDEIIESNKENKKPNVVEYSSSDGNGTNSGGTKEFRLFEINTSTEIIKLNLDAANAGAETTTEAHTAATTTTSTTEQQSNENNSTTQVSNSAAAAGGTVTVPQTLISCLDELQHNGKLISWKIRGEGENLTVKVTWNSKNNEKKYRKYTTSHFLNRKHDKHGFSKLDESNVSPLTLKQMNTDKKLKEDFTRFKDTLYRCLSDLKAELNAKSGKKMDKVEYDKLLLASRIELVSLITNLVQTLHIKLADTNLNNEKLEYDVKLIVFNEIESCLKLRTGSLIKEMDQVSDSESDYPRAYEDYLATSILRKFTSKQTFSNLVDIMSSNINSDDLTLKEADMDVNWGKTAEVGEDYLDSFKAETHTLRPKQKFSVNDNLLLSLYSLMDKKEDVTKLVGQECIQQNYDNLGGEQQHLTNDLNADELDVEMTKNSRNASNDRDNWSFKKTLKASETFGATTLHNPVVMTIPQPNGPFSPTIGDQDIEQLSDITVNDSNEENVNYEEEDMMDHEEILDESVLNQQAADENIKFPMPKNILITNKNSPKSSSSYYRPTDDRLESDSDTELPLETKRQREEKVKISPKTDIKDPLFIERPSNRLIRIGESAKFQCKVDGTRPLEVFWYKMDEDELQNNEKYELFHDDECYYLKIYNTVQRDVGTYLCVISNDVEQNFDSFTLNLRDNQRNFRSPKFILELSDIEVEEGYSATFKIKLDFGYPKCRVLFYRNSKLILNDPKHEIYYCGDGVYHLHLPYVTDEDNAQYMCVAVNNGGRAVSKAELYVVERENIRRPDMLLKLNNSSYRSLEAFKFIDNDNKYFTKSADSFDNRSSKSNSELNNTKNRTETPSTVSYELLNDTYYETSNKFQQDDVILKGVNNLSPDNNVFAKESVLNEAINDQNEHSESKVKHQQQQNHDDTCDEILEEQDQFNETNETFMPKKYSPYIENSLTLVTNPLTRHSDHNMVSSSSSVGSSILQMITPRNQQQQQQQQIEKPSFSITNDAPALTTIQTSNFFETTTASNQNETQNSFNFNQDACLESGNDNDDDDDDADKHGSYDLNQTNEVNNDYEDNGVRNLSIKNFDEKPALTECNANIKPSTDVEAYSTVVPVEERKELVSVEATKKTKAVGRLSIDPIIFERPLIDSFKALQSEYSSIKFEPITERKKIWEQKTSQSSSNLDFQQKYKAVSTTPVNMNEFPSRKWSSLVSIYDEAGNGNTNYKARKASVDKVNRSIYHQSIPLQAQQQQSLSNVNLNNLNNSQLNARNSMTELPSAKPVLIEIVTFEGVEKNSSNTDHNDNASVISGNDNLEPETSAANIVSKLKQKFDHKDQSFVKVASLTCRNVYKDGFKGNQSNSSNHIRPMLSLYEPTQSEASLPKIDSFTPSGFSIESTTSINNGSNIATLTRTTITYNPNSSSSNSDSATTTTTTSSSTLNSSINNSTSSLKNGVVGVTTLVSKSNIHQDDDNKLQIYQGDLASSSSSTAAAYCKIYDSTTDLAAIDNHVMSTSTASNSTYTSKTPSTTSGIGDSTTSTTTPRKSIDTPKKDFTASYDIHVQDLVKDYKKLMSSNFNGSKRRESLVLTKAKLWENNSTSK